MGKKITTQLATFTENKTLILSRLSPESPKRTIISSRTTNGELIVEIVSDDYEEHYGHDIVNARVFNDLGGRAVNLAGMWY